MTNHVVSFEGFEFSPRQRRLVRDGQTVRIGSRAFDILAVLVAQAGSIVTKEQLILAVWPDTFVDENNLRVHISALRRALDDASGGKPIIENIPGRGYCFVATLEGQPNAVSPPEWRGSSIPVRRDELLASLIEQLRRAQPDTGPNGLVFIDLGSMRRGVSVGEALQSSIALLQEGETDGDDLSHHRAALLALLAIL